MTEFIHPDTTVQQPQIGDRTSGHRSDVNPCCRRHRSVCVVAEYSDANDPGGSPKSCASLLLSPRLRPEQFTASINALKESVAGLEASRKQVSDEVADLKRQLAAEQGERKMLAEQLGSLSSRVDSLTASLASRADTLASEPSQKKRAKSR